MRIENFLDHEKGFDLMTLFHVLEHIPNPRDLCRLVVDALNSKGLLAVEVPDVSGGQARLRGWKWQHWPPHHADYFSVKSLRLLWELMGLQLMRLKPKYHFLYPQGIAWKDAVHGTLARLGFHDVITTYWKKP